MPAAIARFDAKPVGTLISLTLVADVTIHAPEHRLPEHMLFIQIVTLLLKIGKLLQ